MAEKSNKQRGFTGVRAREILEHLFTKYGEILAQDIVVNRGNWDNIGIQPHRFKS